jgi:heme/copper-type cytochrome/quinol oxidase subunit 2
MWVVTGCIIFTIIFIVTLVFVWKGRKDFYSDERYISEREKTMDQNYVKGGVGKYRA